MNFDPSSIDRARSMFQTMTNTQLAKTCNRYDIATEYNGRRLTKKQMIAVLIQDDQAIADFGKR